MSSKIAGYRSLADQKQYLKLIAANTVSRFGDSLDAIAFSWVMYQVTGSASLIALILAFNFLPTILLQPFAGVLADRIPKRKVMVLCDFGRAFMVCLTVALYLLNWLNAVTLIGITLLNSTLESLRCPAGVAIIPKILDREKFTAGTALNQTLCRVTELIGMAAAGGIIAFLGNSAALLIDAGTFLFSGIIIGWIRLEEAPFQKSGGSIHQTLSQFGKELADGFRYLKSNRLLLCIIILGAFMNFSATPISAFQTPYLAENLHFGPEMLSALGIAMTAGMGIGAFLTPKLTREKSGKPAFVLCGFVQVLFFLALWMLPEVTALWLLTGTLIAGFVLFGFTVGAQNVIFSAAFMSNVTDELMGRISGIVNAVLCCMVPLGSLLCSLLAAFLPIPVAFLICAVTVAVIYSVVAGMKIFRQM